MRHMETVPERYQREAKARMAARIGDDLAEEFFSVAQSTHRDVVNVAELMAAAYKMGQRSAGIGVTRVVLCYAGLY